MPKSTHSRTRMPHRGPRHDADPDRRVKYALRFRRKGDEVTPETVVVRRHRRTDERSPGQRAYAQRRTARRQRREARRQARRAALDASARLRDDPL